MKQGKQIASLKRQTSLPQNHGRQICLRGCADAAALAARLRYWMHRSWRLCWCLEGQGGVEIKGAPSFLCPPPTPSCCLPSVTPLTVFSSFSLAPCSGRAGRREPSSAAAPLPASPDQPPLPPHCRRQGPAHYWAHLPLSLGQWHLSFEARGRGRFLQEALLDSPASWVREVSLLCFHGCPGSQASSALPRAGHPSSLARRRGPWEPGPWLPS